MRFFEEGASRERGACRGYRPAGADSRTSSATSAEEERLVDSFRDAVTGRMAELAP